MSTAYEVQEASIRSISKAFVKILPLGRAALDILISLGPHELLRRLSLWSRKVYYRRRNARPIDLAKVQPAQRLTHPRSDSLRVMFVAGTVELLSRRYRIDNIREQLTKQHVESRLILDIDLHRKWQDALAADVVVFQRVPATPEMIEFASHAKKCGIKLAFDMDDLLFTDDIFEKGRSLLDLPAGERQILRRLAASYREMLLCCDSLIGSTDFLAEQATSLGRHAYVIRNGLGDEYCHLAGQALARKRQASPESVFRIGYLSGTRTHQHDFEIATGALLRLMQAYPQVRLVICGYLDLPAEFRLLTTRIERHSFMPWQRLVDLSATLDISIAPLDFANELNKAKSALKYFEAAAVQVPVVASPVEDFRLAITHGENGLLAATADDWFHCLKELVERTDYRVLLGVNARADALNRYTSAAQCDHTLEVFRAIA